MSLGERIESMTETTSGFRRYDTTVVETTSFFRHDDTAVVVGRLRYVSDGGELQSTCDAGRSDVAAGGYVVSSSYRS